MTESQQVTKWRQIGSRLGIPTGQLDIIENDNYNKAERCCLAMLMYWCDDNPSASLEILKEEVLKLQSIAATVDISVVEQVKSFLLHRYDKGRYSKLIKLGLPYKPGQFTNVAYIHHKHSEVTEESVTAVAKLIYNGDIIIDSNDGANAFLQSLQPNDYYSSCTKDTNILEFLHTIDSIPKRKPFLVLMEGAPGIGKTSLCKEIAYQWSKDDKSALAFLICLHETATQNITSFETLFEYICPGKQLTQLSNVSDYLATGADKRVLVIIDAYEELLNNSHSNSKTFINSIIKRDVLQFQKCDLVISTRCAAAVIDLSEHKNWHRIELLGFTEEQQQQYLECNAERDVVKLTNYLNAKPVLKSLCFHPLFINTVVFLYNRLEHLPNFQTELINKFVCIMILWVLQHQPDLNIVDITLSVLLQNLPEKYKIAVREICKLAFNTLQENIFGSKYVDTHALIETQSYQASGFFKVLKNKKFSFHLLIIQEYLATLFVMQSGDNLKNLWVKTEWHHKYINVWAYYFGLRKVVPEKIKGSLLASSWFIQTERLSSKILQDKISCLYLVYCLRELPDEGIYQQAKQVVLKTDNILDISNCRDLANESLSIVTSFLSCYIVRQWKHFSLSNCSLDDDKLDKILHLFLHRVKYMPKVDTLDLSTNRLAMKSITGIFKIAYIMNISKVLLSHNDKVKDEEICKNLVYYTETLHNLEVVENNETIFLCHKVNLHDLQSTLTKLYIIRCPLDVEVCASLVTVLKTHETLSLLYLYDNNALYNELLKLSEVLKNSKHLTSVLVFGKSILDVNMDSISSTILTNFALIQILLVSTSKLLAQGAANHQILAALEYNPSIVHLQLNDCRITDDVMSKIAVILNSSSQQWSLLDLSGSKIGDDALKMICSALDSNCTVETVKLVNNELTSLCLIIQLIQCLNPSAIDICGNSFAMDDSSASVSMIIAEELFAHDKQLSLTLTCDDDNVLLCNQTAVTGDALVSHSITQLISSNCIVSGEVLLKSLDNNYKLTSLYLANTKWSREPFYNLTETFEKNIFFSACENGISEETLGYLVNKFDTDVNVSSIISTNDIFIANKCHFNVLKLYLIQKLSQLSSNVNLFYVRNCFLEREPNIISDYLRELNMVTEIMLCNNGLSRNNVYRIIKSLKQLKMLKSVFICELQKQLLATKIARYLLHLFNFSFIIIEDKVVIGNQASLEQLGRCLRLVSPSTTILRFISCSFGNEHYNTLVDVLNHRTALEEFSLYECNTNNIWTKQLVEALQVKSKLMSLLLSFGKVTPLAADSIAIALFTVINNNPTLENVSFKFDNLPSSGCSKIFQALSNIRHLKHFRFCDGQVTTKEAIEQLYKVIANNSSLEVVNLRNNRLRNSGIKALAKGFKNIHHLKLLALNGNQIDEEAADDIASVIANNVEIEKLLLYNNALTSEGICTICQALKHHKKLKSFRISNNNLQERAAYDIAEVVNHNPLLKVVDIGNNRLLAEGVMMITSCLHNLQKLSVNENNITCTANAAISIASIISSSLQLKSLHLDNNNFSVSDVSIIAEAINKLTGLKELTVNNTGFTADHISTMIANNLLLEILDIGDNKLKSEGISDISKALIKLSHLRVLGLYGNDITNDAADDIAGVISKLPVLEKLQLSNNTFGVVGIKSICEGLHHNKALKLLQLDDIGITEEVADDIAAVIDSNPLLEYIYLGNNKLHSDGAKVILNSLKNKKHFKALGLNNNCISEDVVDNVVQFVTSNPELEELLLSNNSIGTTGVINICQCFKDINSLRIFSLTDNDVSNEATEATDAFISVIKSNTALEEISLDDSMLLNNIVSTTIIRVSKLKCMQINCTMVSENSIYKSVNFTFVNSNIEEITLNYLGEEMHLLSPVNTIETVVVIKANISKSAPHMPVLHSVVMEDRVEIVCTQDDVLVESEVMKLINVKTCKRIMLVITRMNCYTDPEINVLGTAVANYKNINSLVISNVNSTKYNNDVSGIIIIEKSEMIVMLTDGSLTATGIMKWIQKVDNIISLKVTYTKVRNFFDQNINEIVHLIFTTTKLKYFFLRNDFIHVNTMKNVFNCLTKTTTIKTVRLLNNLNIRNFDFTQKNDELAPKFIDEIDRHQWDKIFGAFKHNVTLKGLDLSENNINKEVAQSLSFLINEVSNTMESLNLKYCSIGTNLKYINLQKVCTLKHLDLSNNYLTEDEQVGVILSSNTMLEKLCIDRNCFQQNAGDRLSIVVSSLRNLKDFRFDGNIVSGKMVLRLTTSFSMTAGRTLWIYNHDYQSTEAITVIGSSKNVTTLTLCKSATIENVSFLTDALKTGVLCSLWDQDNALISIVGWLSAFFNITTIKLLNGSRRGFTEQEEDTIATIIKENSQLEHVILGSHSFRFAMDDFLIYESEHSNSVSILNNDSTGELMLPSPEFLLKIVSALQYHINLKTLNLSVCSNIRNIRIETELAEQLAIVLANSTKLETLLLEDCSLGNEGVNVIANSLKNITTLKHLDLSNNNISEEVAILTILNDKAKLKELYLHKNCLHFSTLHSLSDNVNLECLKVLSIDHNIISSSMIMKCTDSYFSSNEIVLYIYNSDHQTTEVIKFRDSFKNIRMLTLRKSYNEKRNNLLVTLILGNESGLHWNQSNVLTPTGVVRFLIAFRNITTLNVLNFSGSEFTELEVDTIVTVISDNLQLENLWLCVKAFNASDSDKQLVSPNQMKIYFWNRKMFPRKLLLRLFPALRLNTNLKKLDLSSNVITEELAEQLAIVLANFTKLETLLLEDCSLGNEGINVVANSLKNITTLKHLDLSNNEITKESAIVSILEANTGLERLYLKQNYLHSTTGDRLSDAIINLKNLKELGIDQYIISSKMTFKLLSFYANTNGRLFVYNHDYQTIEMLHNEGSLCNINTLTLCKISIDMPLHLITTVLKTGAAVLRWHQANSLRATGILKVFSAVNNITTIKLHSFDNELNELEVDTMASIISDNMALTNVWLGSHSCKVAYDDFDTITGKHSKYIDCIDDLEFPPPKLQLIPHTQLFKILIALRHNVNLKTLDLSGNVITEGLAEQLAIVLANSTKLETLLLGDCSLSSAGIHVITNSLKNATSLKQLSLSWDNINTDVETNYLTTVIECNVGLETLFLDGNLQCFNRLSTAIKKLVNLELLQIDYKVMSTTCELVAFLVNSKLKYLILKNHSLQITGVVKFESYPRNIKSLMVRRTAGQDPVSVKASVDDSKITVTWSKDTILASTGLLGMFSLFKGLTSVSWLNLTLNDYSEQDIDEIVTIMASFTGLEELVIGGYSTALQNCILNSLTTCTFKNLISLDLSCSRMNTNAITRLATFISSSCKIQELNLNVCLLTSSQMTKIVNALQTQSDMRSLYLSNNHISNGHGITVDIAQALLNNSQSMQKFYIGNNRLKTRDIIKILEVLKQCHKLTELFIGPYSIFDDISDRCTLETKPDEFVAEIITNNPELSVLGITCTCVHTDGAAKVVTALKCLSCLKMLDISGNNINEEVADDVATVFTNNPDLTKLSISDNCLGTAGISKIADALASTRGLEIFNIANTNISSGAAESISKMIANNSQLKALLLGREKVRNIVSSHNESHDGVSAMKLSNIFMNIQMVVIKQYAKAKLYFWFFFTYCITLSSSYCRKVFSDNLALNSDLLNFNKLQSQGIEEISKALATIKSLEVLSIENNDVDDEAADDIAAALTSNIGIKQLWIGQNKLTSSGISTILQPLIRATSNKLEVLDLSHSNLLLTTTILEILSKNYNIQQLWLEGNNLSSQYITTIADALKKCTNISVLSLRDNNISEEVANVLSEALSNKCDLQQLYLGNNHLQDGGVIKITEALNTTQYLQTLDLMNNNISEAAADALASVITSCSQLEQLYLGDNKLQSTGTIKITRALQQAKCRSTLRVLDLSNNRIAGSDETVGDEISRAVGNTEILTVLILDDNAISVDGVWKITRSLSQSAEYMMIFSVMRNDVMISEETKDEMRAVMAGQQPDCAMYL